MKKNESIPVGFHHDEVIFGEVMNPCIEYKTPTPDGVKKLVVMEEE